MAVAKNEAHKIHAVCFERNLCTTIQSFAPTNVSILSGDILQLNLNEKYDLILSDLPFGMHVDYTFDGEKIIDTGIAIAARCIELLNDEGYIIAPFTHFSFQKLVFLEKESLYINAVIDLPVGTYSYTSIPSKLVVFSKNVADNRFVAQLSSIADIQSIVGSFFSKKTNKSAILGMFVDPKKCSSFSMYQQKLRMEKLEKQFLGQQNTLEEIAVNVHRPNADKEFKDQQNSIFIPKIGISKVVTSINDFEIKPQNYIQVSLKPELILARYAAFFFNSPKGLIFVVIFSQDSYRVSV
jgi:hypothetical protein